MSVGFAVKWFSTASSCGTCTQQARHCTAQSDAVDSINAGFTIIELTRVRYHLIVGSNWIPLSRLHSIIAFLLHTETWPKSPYVIFSLHMACETMCARACLHWSITKCSLHFSGKTVRVTYMSCSRIFAPSQADSRNLSSLKAT